MKSEEFRHEQKFVYPSLMRTDYSYQRDIRSMHVKHIFGEFNINLVQAPKVSLRKDGFYYIMDGSHTVNVWKMKFGDRPIKCDVYYDMSWQDEAEMFLAQTGRKLNVAQKEMLNTKINMKDEEVLDMKETVEKLGFKLNVLKPSKGLYQINAVEALYKIYQRLGRNAFREVMDVVEQSFKGEEDSVSASFLKGMTRFWETYVGRFSKNQLIAKLKEYPASWYVREAKGMTTGKPEVRFCRAFVKAYNYRRQTNRLEDIA